MTLLISPRGTISCNEEQSQGSDESISAQKKHGGLASLIL